MASDFGSIGVLVKLIGGAQVLKELKDIRTAAKELEAKPFQLKVDVSQVVKAQKEIADAKTKLNATDKEAMKTGDWRLRLEEAQLKAVQRANQEEVKRAANLAKSAEATSRRANAEEQAQRKMVGLQMQAQKEVDTLVNKQAAGFQRAIADVDKYQKAVQLAKNETINNFLNGLSSGLSRAGGMWDGIIRGVSRFSDGLTHAGQVAATFAYRMTLISAPFDILLAKSFQFTTQLEMGLAKVGTQLDGTLEKIRAYGNESKGIALDLQAKYGVGANDISSALYYQVSSGVEPTQAQAALEPLTKLAAASQTNPATISQSLTAALNVFREQLSTIPDLADRSTYALEVMWAATKKGRFEFEDFATQFGRSAGQAEAAGLTFEQTAAMLASLSQVFTPSQSSTSLNSFMKAFIDPTPEAKGAWKEIGVAIYQTLDGITTRRPAFEVFLELMDKLQGKYATNAEIGDKLTSSIFGDIRGGRATQLFNDPKQVENLKNILSSIEGAGTSGGIQRDWELISEQIQTQINIVIGKFYQLGDVAIGYLKPAIKGGLEGLKVFFDGLAANPQVVGIITQVAAAMAILAPTMLVVGTALMGVGGIVTAIATLMSPAYLIGFGLAWEALAPSITKAATAVEFFGGGITGILATVTEFARQMGLIKDTDAAKIFESLGVTQNLGGVQSVTDLIGGLKELAPDVTRLRDGIMGIAQGIGMLIDNISNGKGILGGFASLVKEIGGGLSGLGLGGAEGFARTLDLVIGGSLVAKIGGALVGALAKIVVGVQNVTAGQVNVVGAGANGLGSLAGGVGGLGSSLYDKNPALAGAGLVGFATIAATLRQQFMDEVAASQSPITKGVFIGEDIGNPLFGAVAQIAKMLGVDLVKSFDDVLAKVDIVGIITGEFKPKSTGATPQDIRNFASGNTSGLATPDDIRNFAASQQSKPATDLLTGAVIVVRNFIDNTGSALDELAAKAYGAAAALANVEGSGVPTGYGAPPEAGAGYGDYARSEGLNAFYQKLYPDVVKFVGDKSTEYVNGVKAATDATKKFADAAKAAAKQLMDTIRGLVRDSLQTAVTDEQVKRSDLEVKLAKLKAQLDSTEGKPNQRRNLESAISDTENQLSQLPAYQNSPDEFRRRTEAVATGTDPSTYGAEYQQQLALAQSKMPGASLADIAKSFGDFSLFANMSETEIDQMWDFDAVAAGVKRGIDKIVGEFKVMGQAVKEVLDNMPADQMAALKEALGLGADTSLSDVESGVMGALGMGTGGASGAIGSIGATISDDDVTKITTIAGAMKSLDSLKDMIIKIVVDSAAWEIAKAAIDEAEKYIQDHILAYKDIAISITGSFTEVNNGGGGGAGTTGGTDGGSGGGAPPGKATGGYVNNGIYQLGEQGYEYILPHRMVRWMEKILGGKISSPEAIQWLIGALGGGKDNTMTHLGLWASGVTGVSTPLPEDADKWFNNIKVLGRDKKKMGYADFLWQKGQPAASGSSSGGGGGSSGGGTGGGGSIDFGAFDSAVTRFAKAVDLLLAGLSYNPQFGSLGGGGGGGNGGTNIGVLNLSAPNGATFDWLSSEARSLAAHGMD